VQADPDRVLQIFSNLLGNAVKFTPSHGRIVVAAAQDGKLVRFSVSDTGPGLSADERQHVFDRFWQAEETGRFGIGLGLSIAKGLVEAQGGHIWAEGVPGQGTTFFFTLPIAAR
jgi:signal transduction histidine kinase